MRTFRLSAITNVDLIVTALVMAAATVLFVFGLFTGQGVHCATRRIWERMVA